MNNASTVVILTHSNIEWSSFFWARDAVAFEIRKQQRNILGPMRELGSEAFNENTVDVATSQKRLAVLNTIREAFDAVPFLEVEDRTISIAFTKEQLELLTELFESDVDFRAEEYRQALLQVPAFDSVAIDHVYNEHGVPYNAQTHALCHVAAAARIAASSHSTNTSYEITSTRGFAGYHDYQVGPFSIIIEHLCKTSHSDDNATNYHLICYVTIDEYPRSAKYRIEYRDFDNTRSNGVFNIVGGGTTHSGYFESIEIPRENYDADEHDEELVKLARRKNESEYRSHSEDDLESYEDLFLQIEFYQRYKQTVRILYQELTSTTDELYDEQEMTTLIKGLVPHLLRSEQPLSLCIPDGTYDEDQLPF
ncbi:MAG: hypothetical protein IPF79_02570 [Ignavibacteria bacterium]|nr:hypothetical protein [Ignavibacteria bacterium]